VPRDEHGVLAIVDHVYAGILEATRWEHALAGFAALLDARAAGVRIETAGQGVHQHWVGLEPSFDRAYVEQYWRDDPWAARVWQAKVGDFAHGDALCPRALVEQSSFHNELALASGFDDLAGGVIERDGARVVTIGVMKGRGRRRFDARTDALARLVLPHFGRALALRDRVGGGAPAPAASSLAVEAALAERLRLEHGLTPAEVRVAVRIGRGRSPKEVAAELGSSWFTVRSQLRQIFAKTETRSQSALARMVTLLEARIARERAL